MNRVIRKSLESAGSRPVAAPAPSPVLAATAAPQPATSPSAPSPSKVMTTAPKVESILIETVIRHGNEIIFRDVTNDATGEKINLTVA